jgi:hypothetical protein
VAANDFYTVYILITLMGGSPTRRLRAIIAHATKATGITAITCRISDMWPVRVGMEQAI